MEKSEHSIHEVLKKYWGYSSFRPLQEDVVRSVLSGNDTLALMPTGGGKSICYQVPAMTQDGLCLVISPLIALMKDQVENLRKRNITAYAIYSGMQFKDVVNTLKVAGESNCKFLYVSPERLETSLFREYLPGLGISLLAVDEAHCISQWGYDFRPPYLRIAALREEVPGVPVLALTASATPDVQLDICDKLNSPQNNNNKKTENNWNIFRQSFERANLSYSVFKVDSRINKIIDILKTVPGTAIVYCKSRKRTKEFSDLLKMQGIASDYYHAGLTQDDRNRKQEEWISNKIRVIVCTNAFGMGIDKPDVRAVIHADVPDCLENYYQEAGRCGRDGKKSYAVLLHDNADLEDLAQLPTIRFPTLNNIREAYHAIVNYLQVPARSGQGEYFDFDIADFTNRFKLDSHSVFYALKALEQEGWLSFTENVFRPGTVNFNITKERLYEFEKNNPGLEPLLKTLLRTYEGIFDHPAFVNETVIAGLMRTDVLTIREKLNEANHLRVIEYNARKETPQLMLLRDRVPVQELQFDMTAYKKRKDRFESRVRQMIAFTNEKVQCRSQVIGSYFGDDGLKPCGICDNCLQQKKTTISKTDFENITTAIMEQLKLGPMEVKTLTAHLKNVNKEKAWKVIEFLQAEQRIEVDDKGFVKTS